MNEDPFIIGTPATSTLSLRAAVKPLSLPSGAPWIEVLRYHAFSGSSSGPGRYPGVRGYLTSGRGSTACRVRSAAAKNGLIWERKLSASPSANWMPMDLAMEVSFSGVGREALMLFLLIGGLSIGYGQDRFWSAEESWGSAACPAETTS